LAKGRTERTVRWPKWNSAPAAGRVELDQKWEKRSATKEDWWGCSSRESDPVKVKN